MGEGRASRCISLYIAVLSIHPVGDVVFDEVDGLSGAYAMDGFWIIIDAAVETIRDRLQIVIQKNSARSADF